MNGTFDRRCASLHHPDDWAGTAHNARPSGWSHNRHCPVLARPHRIFAVDGSRCQELLMCSTVQKPDDGGKGWYTLRVRNLTDHGGQIFRIHGQQGVLQISRKGSSFNRHCETHGGAICLPAAQVFSPDYAASAHPGPSRFARAQHFLNNSTISSIFRKFSLSLLLYKNFLKTREMV